MYPLSILSIAFLLIAPQFCNGQSNGPAIEQLKWTAIVGPTKAIFTFPPSSQAKWNWHNADTKNNALEYAWNVGVGGETNGYRFGPSLFHYDAAGEGSGKLSDLLTECQHTLWEISKDGGKSIGDYGKAKVIDRSVVVTITDEKLIEKLFDAKPEYVQMTANMPHYMLRKKVNIKYNE